MDEAEPLWTPTHEQIERSAIDRFRRKNVEGSANTADLWQWSVDEPGRFWRALWDWAGVVGDPGPDSISESEVFHQTRFLPDATLSVAENLLTPSEGHGPDAIIAVAEDNSERRISWDELRSMVAAAAAVFVEAGVGEGDLVAAWMPHVPETVVAFLAASSLGAVFTSTSADFGVDGVVDRFGQTEPKVLVAADGYTYGGRSFDLVPRLREITAQLPSVQKTLLVGYLDESPTLDGDDPVELWSTALARYEGVDFTPRHLPADHPLYILYSSGTTGKPKCIVHRSGGVLLKHMSEQILHSDIRPGDKVMYFTTAGWMMWNWLVSALATGATIVLVEGNPGYPDTSRLFDLAGKLEVSLLGVSAKYIDAVMKSGVRPGDENSFDSLRTICSTGSPLTHEGFAWVYDAVSPDVHLASISGGTDLCGCLVIGDPTRPVYAGEIQGPALGVATNVFDVDGNPTKPGEKGELVCTAPFPSMPLEFWDDVDDVRYRAAYFERFDNVWAHGDYASWTDNGGMVIHGRSDATLNASGVRIGTAEIYRVVENLPEISEAIAIGQEWDGDTRIVLFVRMFDRARLTEELIGQIKADLRSRCSPRHVPAVIAEVSDIPRTRSGKIVELAVTEVVHGREVANIEALANPEALTQFTNRPELT